MHTASRWFALCFGLTWAAAASALPAFPGAEGYGGLSEGGRGGDVYVVRSLCDYAYNGPAECGADYQKTLRYAVTRTGKRTVVFDLSGEIVLKGTLYVSNPYLTIAGQSAPSPGITLSADPGHVGMTLLNVRTQHVIVRHLRLRGGASLGRWQNHAILVEQKTGGQPQHVIFDHVSASWATDDVVGLQNAKDVTFQWSIVSESLQLTSAQIAAFDAALEGTPNCPGPVDTDDTPCTNITPYGGKGMLMDSSETTLETGRLSIHHNLFVHHYKRTPQFNAGALAGNPDAVLPVEVVNNVAHDFVAWGTMFQDGTCGVSKTQICPVDVSCVCGEPLHSSIARYLRANLIGNTFTLSPVTLANWGPPSSSYARLLPFPPFDPWTPRDVMFEFLMAKKTLKVPTGTDGMSIYLDDNHSWRRYDDPDEGYPEYEATDAALPLCTQENGKVRYTLACDASAYTTETPHPRVGASPPIRVQYAGAAEIDVLVHAGALYRSEDPVDLRVVSDATNRIGTMQTSPNPALDPIAVHRRQDVEPDYDTEPDGMRDAWEIAQYGSTDLTPSGDLDQDGYTNLEEFLNGTQAKPSVFSTANNGTDGSLEESSESSDVGGGAPSTGAFRVGDLADRRQVKSIVSFDTSSLPDSSPITRAEIRLTLFQTGGDPTSLGALVGDVKTGSFGTAAAHVPSDFQAAATVSEAVTVTHAGGGVYTGLLGAAGIAAINRTGITQIRLRFVLDDDDDSVADDLDFNPEAPPPTLTVQME
jgi:hypothetical protein